MLSADEVSQIESAIASLPRFKGNRRRARLRVCPDFSRSFAAGYPIPRNCGLSSPEMWAVERVAQVAAIPAAAMAVPGLMDKPDVKIAVAAIVRFLEWNAAVHAPSFTEATHIALVDLARAAMAALKDGLPRAGGGSWQFPKFFGILRLTYFVMEFGPIMFYSTQWCVPSPRAQCVLAVLNPLPSLPYNSFERDHKDEKKFKDKVNGSEDTQFQMWRRNLAADVASAYSKLTDEVLNAVRVVQLEREDGFAPVQHTSRVCAPLQKGEQVGSKRKRRSSAAARAVRSKTAQLVGHRASTGERPRVREFFEGRPDEELKALLAFCESRGRAAESIEAVKTGALACGDAVHASVDYYRRPWFSSVILLGEGADGGDAYGEVTLLAHVFSSRGVSEQVAIMRVMEPKTDRCPVTDMLLLRWAGERPRPQTVPFAPRDVSPFSLFMSVA